ncbi:YesL family protein [Aquibacillus rhizosphaerae]|uniref:YesL family protein n=1 Tax=Aquibacillus rhizosphaerae TaxID=3051431 RepID=A0ABT7L323_9BACI|nr:YesL family protein [Aquibacillus sp. LR5S19]MDL4840270.1 YesL family protein [Aquibacillus sp. LR5S19]
MEIRGLWGGFYTISQWVMRFVYINLLWIFFTILGLIFFGLMPATISMFTVIRKWIMKQTDIPIFQTFFITYKKEFLKSNLFMVVILVVGVFLYFNLRYAGFMVDSTIYPILLGGFIITTFLYMMLVIYIAPVYVHFNLSFAQYVKYAIMIGATNLHYSITIIVSICGIYYISMKVPGLVPFFSISVSAYIIMFGANLAFNNLVKKKQQLEQQ